MSHTLEQLRTGQLAGIGRLKLACGLTEFPREIFDLADSLEILDLSGNALSSLPDDLPRLTHLRVLFCSDNQFTALPEVLGACPRLTIIGFKANRIRLVSGESLPLSLRWLILTDNLIEALPARIGQCLQLQKLMLAGNQLQSLPPQLVNCRNLELLRISANRLTGLPAWLLALPRLSWLACAGNPFCETREQQVLADAGVPVVDWRALQIHNQLGEGASGVIHRAQYQDGYALREVAVKLFKGVVTSDGLPRSEMAACLAAGAHPHLIGIVATVVGHPANLDGLVMPLIDPVFGNMAGPPSLDSCTRDIYPDNAAFELAALLRIAHGIASAAAHLHERGVLHGDLYGHNILHDEAGHPLLGDFGAASLFAVGTDEALALQRLEVRAFGCLLEELIARATPSPGTDALLAQLSALQRACLQDETGRRPLFADLAHRLSLLG